MTQPPCYLGVMDRTENSAKPWIKTPISPEARRALDTAMGRHRLTQNPLLSRLLEWFGHQPYPRQRAILTGLTPEEILAEADLIRRQMAEDAERETTRAAEDEQQRVRETVAEVRRRVRRRRGPKQSTASE